MSDRVYHQAEAGGAAGADDGGSAGKGPGGGASANGGNHAGGTGGNAGSSLGESGEGGAVAAQGGSTSGTAGTAGRGSGRGGSGGTHSTGGGTTGGSAGTSAGESGAGQSGEGGASGCPTGFTGPGCNVNIDDCAGVNCGANGHCVDGVASHACACDPGFTGASCSLARLERLTPNFGMSCGNAISGDGSVVVGYEADGPRSSVHPIRWTEAGGAVELTSNTDTVDYGSALAVNSDGSVVAGEGALASSSGVFRWTQAGGVVIVGPDIQVGLSSNGTTLVGREAMSDGTHLYRWTQATGVVDFGLFGAVLNVAALSGDGTTAVGDRTVGSQLSQAFRWTASDGVASIGPADVAAYATGVSADGRVVVGTHQSMDGSQQFAFRWDPQSGPVDLDLGSLTYTSAANVSSDGSIILGMAGQDGWLWSSAKGPRLLQDILAGEGVDLTHYSSFRPSDISDDGTIVTGCVFTDDEPAVQGFVARIGD